jgi:histidinol dehydrogenase
MPTADAIVARYLELRDYVKARTDELETTGALESDRRSIELLRSYKDAAFDKIADRLEQLLTPLKQYKDAMTALQGAADMLMKQTGQKALSTEHGTAYYSHTLSVTCEDPQKFLDFVFQHGARQFLTSHVAKEAVQTYMDGPGQGHPPPGVKVTPFISVNFRKA